MLSTCENHYTYVVVYEGRGCPVCRMESELAAAEREAKATQAELDATNDKCDELQGLLDIATSELEEARANLRALDF